LFLTNLLDYFVVFNQSAGLFCQLSNTQHITKICRQAIVFFAMVFNATFNNISAISWRSVLLVEETGGPGDKIFNGINPP
jgi:hypothetical protein